MISRNESRAGIGHGGRFVLLLVATCLLPLALGRAAIAVLPAIRTDGSETSADAANEAVAQRSPDRAVKNHADPKGRRCVPKLRYEAKPRETHISCNGRMVFLTRLINDGEVPVVVYWGDYAYEDMYCFAISREDDLEIASPRRRLVPPNGTVRKKYFFEIPPGESVSYNVHLSPSPGANCQRHHFRLPGVYTVRPSFSATISESLPAAPGQDGAIRGAWTGDLDAEPVTITIEGDPKIESDCFQLSGQVVDPGGKPVVGAYVVAQRRITSFGARYGHSLSNLQQAHTDAEGRYSLLGLPLDCPSFFLEVTHPQWPDARETVTMAPPKKRYETKIVLPQGVTLRGEVVDSSGTPIAGVRVGSRGKEVWTDADGHFVLEGVPPPDEGDDFYLDFWKRDSISRTLSISREKATGTSCRIKLLRSDELTASGRAVFVDGSPAANLTLEFHIPGTRQWVRDTKTDPDGRFSVELPEPRAFKGHVDAIEPGEFHLPRRRWSTEIKTVEPGQNDLKLVFDNRGQIHVTVKPDNTLPTSLHFDVTCEMSVPSGGSNSIATASLGSEGGEIDFENLAPGKYRLNADVKEAGHWNWSREAVVGERPDDRSVEVEFKLPTMEFGSVKALILQPDGRTPVRHGRIWFDSSKSWGSVQFFAGKVELPDIPVGRFHLETRIDSMAQQSLVDTVSAGQMTDLGQVTVQRLEDAAGWVEGRVLYDDGSPVLGTEIGSVDPIHGATAVEADGAYRIQLMAGENVVDFNLSNASGWPASAAFMKTYENRFGFLANDSIVAQVQVEPGETISRDFVLPRKPLRNITLNWAGDPEEKLFISVIVDMKDYRLIRRYPFGLAPGAQFEISHLGSGPTIVSVYAEDYFGYREIAAGANDVVLTFDPDEAGFMEVQTAHPNGMLPESVGVTARPASLTSIGPTRSLRSRRSIFNMERTLIQPGGETGGEAETSVRVTCSPGRYTLTSQSSRTTERIIEVKSGQTTKVTIIAEDH